MVVILGLILNSKVSAAFSKVLEFLQNSPLINSLDHFRVQSDCVVKDPSVWHIGHM